MTEPVPASQRSADPSGGRDAVVNLEGGRRLTWRGYGAAGGFPVLALHGTPGSRLKFSAADGPAAASGLRVIAPDRWAYGGTDPHPAPTLAAYAGDVERLVDGLGIDRFAVLGVSGGGPYAAAVAARLGRRVAAAALVSPVGPVRDTPPGEIAAFHRFCFGPLASRPVLVRAVFSVFRAGLSRNAALALRLSLVRAPEVDRRIIARNGTGSRLAASFVEGLSQGARGPAIDLALFGRPWDVELAAVTAPCRVWIGSADTNVPIAAARRLASLVPSAGLEAMRGAGHLWVAENYAAVLDWIAGARA